MFYEAKTLTHCFRLLADLGVVGSTDYIALVRKGQVIGKFPPDQLEVELLKELQAFRDDDIGTGAVKPVMVPTE